MDTQQDKRNMFAEDTAHTPGQSGQRLDEGQSLPEAGRTITSREAKSLTQYVPLLVDIYKNPAIKEAAYTLGLLLFHLDRDGLTTFKSTETLAKIAKRSPNTIKAHLKTLQAAGLITRKRQKGLRVITLTKHKSEFLNLKKHKILPLPHYAIEPYELSWGPAVTLAAVLYTGQHSANRPAEHYPTNEGLAELTGLTERGVRKALKKLEDLRLITRAKERNRVETLLLHPQLDKPEQTVPRPEDPEHFVLRVVTPEQTILGPGGASPIGSLEQTVPIPRNELPPNKEDLNNSNQQPTNTRAGVVVGDIEIPQSLQQAAGRWLRNHRSRADLLGLNDVNVVIAIYVCCKSTSFPEFNETRAKLLVRETIAAANDSNATNSAGRVISKVPSELLARFREFLAACKSFSYEQAAQAEDTNRRPCPECGTVYDPEAFDHEGLVDTCSITCDKLNQAKQQQQAHLAQQKRQQERDAFLRSHSPEEKARRAAEWEEQLQKAAADGNTWAQQRARRKQQGAG